MASKHNRTRMSTRLIWLVSLLPSIAKAQNFPNPEPNCDGSVKPVALPYKNVTVVPYYATEEPVVSAHKCFAITFGDASAQKSTVCMGIGANMNSTIVAANHRKASRTSTDEDSMGYVCNPKDPGRNKCLAFRGGLYNSDDKGSSFVLADLTGGDIDLSNTTASNQGFDYVGTSTGTKGYVDPFAGFDRGWDQVTFGDATIKGYPLVVINDYTFPFGTGVIGLATDSAFLKSAVKSKKIPSRSWGFEYGRMEGTEGELVLGGYNADKFDKTKASEFDVFPNKNIPCPLQVQVKSLTWGKNNEFLNAKPFTACVEPTYHTTVMPLEIQRQWNKTWSEEFGWESDGIDWEYTYFNRTRNFKSPPEDEPIKITLEGGFAIEMPINNFWNTRTEINETTGVVVYPDEYRISTRIANGGFDTTKGQDPKIGFLGAPFLSQVYLAVDYEANKFYLQEYNKPNRPVQFREPQNMQILGCKRIGSDPENKGLAKWKLAIIILFAILAVIAILLLALYLLKRAHKKRDAEAAAALAANTRSDDHNPTSPSVAGAYGYSSKPGIVPVTRSDTAYSEVPGSPYNGGAWSSVSSPTSPPPGGHAPAYSEIYGTERASSTVPSRTSHGHWNNWGSPQTSPGLPEAPTATGFAPVEMAGDGTIAEMGSTPVGGRNDDKR